ncbi:TetR/AcrR family transcriptional regulator [Actinomycetospora termitidis]|uniref:TetR/AcrR family transcriptional regulator n=1 Tax=Actinomycetospora termitidis TaxID=3053470 RepID=A0ABT7MCK0_9PSEU|nr:TetR/AcrR family transcriptional regulator [Actinomycetospora sp. Odt1-22]MDL5158394.1 TetR/AcrR family transcriptional regulator [Actinomycetospora sp. Odt1-22]
MRREPSQERSRATVDRILGAARTVLAERGYDGAGTNRIAAAAGVGPGTVYQYFEDKDAILDRVLEQVSEDLEARILRAFLGTLHHEHDTVRANVEMLLDALTAEPGLVRALAEHAPRTLGSRRRGFAQRVDQLVAGTLLAQHRDESARVETVAWMLVRVAEHVTISWVLEAPDVPRETLVEELSAMIGGYLARLGVPAAD